MMKVKNLLTGMLAVLAVLLLTGCQWNENPVRTSLDILQTDLTLQVGESATRAASTESKDYEFIYSSSNPAVAIVDQSGKVTAMSEGTATITVTMPETKIGWYAAATRQYKVIVNKVSAAALVDVDKSTPLTLVAAEDGKITVTFNNGVTLKNDIHYTINGGAEQTIAKNTSGAYDITVKKGDVVQLYSLNSSLGGGAVAGARGGTRAVDSGAKYINIRPSMKTEIYGNVMSLLKGKDNLESATALEAKNAFYGLFAGAEKLVNNTERLLVLPATTLTEGCYQDMFNGCKGIEKAPELPAPTLVKNCYQEMFYDCAKLNHVKCLATDITAEGSTKDWLGKAGTEATETKVLETLVDMTANSDDGVPTSWTAQKIVAVTGIKLDKTELALKVGDAAVQLKATVAPDNVTDKTVTWTSDKPTVATVDETGKVTAVAAGTATITAQAGDKTATCVVTVTEGETYLKWDDTQKKLVATLIPENATAVTNANESVNWSAGTYVVEGNVEIGGIITLQGDVNLIIKDGARLTANMIDGNDKNLHIYGQSEMTGQLVVDCSSRTAIDYLTTLEIHSCMVIASSSAIINFGGFSNIGTFNVYGGLVDAQKIGGTGYGISLKDAGALNIYGGEVKAKGEGDADGSRGIMSNDDATITVYGGKLWAGSAQRSALGDFTLTKGAGFTGKIQTSGDNESWTDWESSGTPATKYVRVGY